METLRLFGDSQIFLNDPTIKILIYYYSSTVITIKTKYCIVMTEKKNNDAHGFKIK
jgi:hypothetical protein